jgi:3alpha(or 20beta)-hydroxysteroid dehydrogenase
MGDVLDDKGTALAAELGAASSRFVHHDVTSPEDWAAAVAAALDAFGRLDVLVNNAGVLKFGAIADMPLADFRRVLEVNAMGCWLGMKSVIEPMTAAGGGSIINISSIEGFTGAAGLGIRVNSVHPGGVLTSMVLDPAVNSGRADGDAFLRAVPMSRFARPAEISRLVVYLASDESSYSTGSEFVADGGVLSGPGY